jgi:chromosome segregation ATPase
MPIESTMIETKPNLNGFYGNPTNSMSMDNVSIPEKKTDSSPSNNIYLLNALKERIKLLEVENSQLHSTLEASNAVESQIDTIKDDLEEERKLRKGLQERLRVILEELEGVKEQNADLQSQLSGTNFLDNNFSEEANRKEKKDLEEKFKEALELEESRKKLSEQAIQHNKLETQNRELSEKLKKQSDKFKTLSAEIRSKSEIVLNLESRYTHLRQVFKRFVENPYERVLHYLYFRNNW